MQTETIKVIAHSKFRGYTLPRLDKHYDILTSIIQDPDASSLEIRIAAEQREEVEACIQLFIQEEIDEMSVTAAMILEVITGKTIVKLQKETPGGALTQDLIEKTVVATKASGQVTKKSLNSFGTWLANKTNTQGGN